MFIDSFAMGHSLGHLINCFDYDDGDLALRITRRVGKDVFSAIAFFMSK